MKALRSIIDNVCLAAACEKLTDHARRTDVSDDTYFNSEYETRRSGSQIIILGAVITAAGENEKLLLGLRRLIVGIFARNVSPTKKGEALSR